MAMEVFFRPTPDLTIKIECRDVEDIFKQLAPLQEVLTNCKCGKCKKDKVRLLHRTVGDKNYDVYEILCVSCGAKLQLGNNGDSLFPRRYEQDPDDPKKPLMKDGKKVWLPNNGWIKWDKDKGAYV